MARSYRYGAEFFDYIERGSRRSAAGVVGLAYARLKPESLLDVGCGRGVWVAEWMKAGVADGIGVDGVYVDVDGLAIPRERFLAFDLAKSFDLGRRFDLVQSFETAEHVAAEHAEVFVDNLCRHGRLVMFSAAVPGQGGETHVNEQPPDYWRQKFLARGYAAYDWLRPIIRDDAAIEPWYRYNSLLFAAEDAAAALPEDLRATKLPADAPVPDVAPLLWRMRNACLRSLPRPVVHRLAILKHKAMNLRPADRPGAPS